MRTLFKPAGVTAALMTSALCALLSSGCSDDTTSSEPTDICTHWSYSGDTGPDHWKDCAAYSDCGGAAQSPINIVGAVNDPTLTDIVLDYDSSKTAIVHTGHSLQWNYDDGSTITMNGVSYELEQFHFHTSSEHTVDGRSYPMEVHFVHKDDATGKLGVVGVMFSEGAANPTLAKFMDNLPTSKDQRYDNAMKYIASDLMPAEKGYYTYPGSLTTPPCSQIVTWAVLKTGVEASKQQIDKMHEIMHTNNRPVQPLNGRAIRMR